MDPNDLTPGQGNEPVLDTPSEPTPPTDDQPVDDSQQSDPGSEPDNNGEPTPPEPQQEMFTLPDGRQVNGKQAFEEYIKLLPDYTRKSQLAAEYQKMQDKLNNQPDYSNLSPEERQARMVLDSLQAEMLEKAKAELTPQIEEIKLQAEIRDLKAKYPDFQEDVILPFAYNKQIWNLEDAYILFNHANIVEREKQKIQQATATNMTRKQNAGITPGSSQSSPPTGLKPYNPETDKGKSLRELFEEGFAEVGIK